MVKPEQLRASGPTAMKSKPGWRQQGAVGWPRGLADPGWIWGSGCPQPASVPHAWQGTAGPQMLLLRGLLSSAPPPVVPTFI